MSALGLDAYGVCLRFAISDDNQRNEIILNIISSKFVSWASTTSGDFDVVFAILAKDTLDFQNKYQQLIANMRNLISYEAFALRLSLKKNNAELVSSNKLAKIDDVDKKILAQLCQNARISLIDIYKQTKIPPTTALSRIRSLEKNKIIQGYTVLLDTRKLGKTSYQVFLKTTAVSSQMTKSLITCCESNKVIFFFVQTIGEWNFEISVQASSGEELRSVLDEMKKILGTSLVFCRVLITDDYYAKYTPVIL